MAGASIRERLAPLNTSNLRSYWLNAVVSAFGDSATTIALTLMVLQETGSLSLMASISMVIVVPGIVFGILSATWVDRWNAQRVIVISQIARALLVLGMVYVDASGHFWVAFVLAASQSLVGTFDDPARARLIRTITDDTTRLSVNSLTSSGVMIASMLGTTVGGGLIGSLDVFWPAFMVNSVTFLIGAAAIARIRGQFEPYPSHERLTNTPRQFRTDVLGGFWVIRSSPILVSVVLATSAANLGLGAATIMLTPLIVDVLNVQPAWFGIVEGAQSSSAVLISLAIGIYGHALDPKRLLVVCMIATGIVVAMIGFTVNIWTLLAVMSVAGIAITPVGSSVSTLVQTHTSQAMVGRVAAVMNTCIQTFTVVSMAGAGVLGDAVGVRPIFWLGGVVCVIAGLLASLLFRSSEESLAQD